MPRPTGRGYALLALAVGTYLAARVVGTWELYFVAFAFFAAVLISWLLVALTGRRIRVIRRLTPDRPVDGDEPEFTHQVENTAVLPGPQITLRSPLAGLSSEGPVLLQIAGLPPRGKTELKTHVGRVNRGVHSLPAVLATAEDPLGIVSFAHKASTSLVVTVLPRIVSLDSCALYPDLGLKHDWSGRQGLRSIGASEFRGIRPHQPGEPLSHIDWKSTAKTGVLMLREMEEPAGADVTILLDGTAGQLVGNAPNSNFEFAVRAAGSIGDFVLRAGHGVTLVSHGRSRRESRFTADGGGRRALLQALAEVQPNASAPLTNALRHLRADGAHLLRAQSVTVVSLSLDQQLVRALTKLKDDGARIGFVYVAGPSFAHAGGASSLLPFLPPKEKDLRDKRRSPHQRPEVEPPEPADNITLSADARALLLCLSSAGIPCLTVARGDDLRGRLSLWSASRAAKQAAR